jgi:hypothetical protein
MLTVASAVHIAKTKVISSYSYHFHVLYHSLFLPDINICVLSTRILIFPLDWFLSHVVVTFRSHMRLPNVMYRLVLPQRFELTSDTM